MFLVGLVLPVWRGKRRADRERTAVPSTEERPTRRGLGVVTRPAARAATPHSVWIGCSGWNYADWRETFYPKGLPARRWLEHYAQLFDTVEVNNTFYRLPSRDAVANWAAQTPPDFVFTVKASRYLTHIKRLTDLGAGRGALLRAHRAADRGRQARSGAVAAARRTSTATWSGSQRALEQLPAGRHCFEFRHPSWFNDEVYAAAAARAAPRS